MKIYMFHYVKKDFNYYHFDVDKFEDIIRKFALTKKIIGMHEIKEALDNKLELNDEYVALTFDDGTIDHYKYVYPILKKYNAKGIFFICSNIFNGEILDIHYIHQLISNVGVDDLYIAVNEYIEKNKFDNLKEKLLTTIYDNEKEKFVKQMLQFILPDSERKCLLNELVKKYNISKDSSEYYVSKENLAEMRENGMEIALHTSNHQRLDMLSYEEQEKEILENKQFLSESNILGDIVGLSYPFGSYDKNTINILKNNGIDIGFAINTSRFEKYEIHREDANVLKGE